MYGDNQYVLANTTVPESTPKNKSNAIELCFVQEGSARDEWGMTYINPNLNAAEIIIKPLPAGEKRMRLLRIILQHL